MALTGPHAACFADGKHGDGDVLRRIVAEHAADSDIYTFLPVAPDDVIRIGLELEAEAHQVTSRTACAVPRLGCEELGGQSGTEESFVEHGPVEAQEVA